MTNLWKIVSGSLESIPTIAQSTEQELEDWLSKDLSMLGLDVLLIGRQVQTDFGGRIDLLAIDSEGDLTIIELKRDKTPREVVAQILDYASWINGITTQQVHEIAKDHLGRALTEAFREYFRSPLPEKLNSNHNMLIVASTLDESSQRIIEYLAKRWEMGINTAFFQMFDDHGQRFLAASWLMDQQEVTERAERRTKAPWTGLWYANVGEGPHRSWDDMTKYGFLAAGNGRFYSMRLEQLSVGDQVYAYQKGNGYVGYGLVKEPARMVRDITLNGKPLLEMPLVQPALSHDKDNAELAEYAVLMDWKKVVPLKEARTFDGVFANQNIVCRLTHPQTIDFLKKEFGPAA